MQACFPICWWEMKPMGWPKSDKNKNKELINRICQNYNQYLKPGVLQINLSIKGVLKSSWSNKEENDNVNKSMFNCSGHPERKMIVSFSLAWPVYDAK